MTGENGFSSQARHGENGREVLGAALEAARGGDPEALGSLLEQFRSWLLVVAEDELADDVRGKLGASDLVQQTFLEAQRDFSRFCGKTRAELAAWLKQILLHNAADMARRHYGSAKRHARLERSMDADGEGAAVLRNELAASDPSPSSTVRARERDDELEQALERLPERYRRVILFRHRHDFEFGEIGRRLNVSPDAARKLWTRAICALRCQLERSDGSES